MAELIDFIQKMSKNTLERILHNLYADLTIFSYDGYTLLKTELMIEAIEKILGGQNDR